MEMFEYKTLHSFYDEGEWKLHHSGSTFGLEDLDAVFTALGMEGWDLVAVSTLTDSKVKSSLASPLTLGMSDIGITKTVGEIYYFKRRVASEEQFSERIKNTLGIVKDRLTTTETASESEIQLINGLHNVGYKVTKKSPTKWKIKEPLGGITICTSLEEFTEYCISRK